MIINSSKHNELLHVRFQTLSIKHYFSTLSKLVSTIHEMSTSLHFDIVCIVLNEIFHICNGHIHNREAIIRINC